MKCLECQNDVEQIDNDHLAECCGLTLQEYAIRHHVSLDLLVNESMINIEDDIAKYLLPCDEPSIRAISIFKALETSGSFKVNEHFVSLYSDVRRLDELLWYLRELQSFGFQYRQEYSYTFTGHRVVPSNVIRTLTKYQHKFPSYIEEVDFKLFLSVIIARAGELRKGYIFLTLPVSEINNALLKQLTDEHQIRWVQLESDDINTVLCRTESLQDSQRLLSLIEPFLSNIPCVKDRFFADVECATVSKELVFDSAHFITDHPGKCENLHGGRYTLNVKIKDRIDPLTGFVIDYGYLKSIVKKRVIEKLDHQNLNFVCADLGWRSSTELLNIFIWEQLIDYLPGLVELQTFETTQSYCQYQGPSLQQTHKSPIDTSLKHFSKASLGESVLRQQLKPFDACNKLKIINK